MKPIIPALAPISGTTPEAAVQTQNRGAWMSEACETESPFQ